MGCFDGSRMNPGNITEIKMALYIYIYIRDENVEAIYTYNGEYMRHFVQKT